LFDHRKSLTPIALAAGLSAASGAWLLQAGHMGQVVRTQDLERRSAQPTPRLPDAAAVSAESVSGILSTPLFGLTAGPGAVAVANVRLDGIAITPGGATALLSIGGKPAKWLAAGASQDGVTLMEVHPGKVVVDTETGFRDVPLGEPSSALPEAQGSQPQPRSGLLTSPSIRPAGQ
jgi:hypothetical protein